MALTTDDIKLEKTRDDHATSTVAVTRVLYTQETFEKSYKADPTPAVTISSKIGSCFGNCSPRCAVRNVLSYFPVVRFARKYKPRQYALGDFLSGLTVSFMHLPQAMGFGILASLRPVHGLYSTFFPVLFYLIFGTSPYISFGTNAVMALLTKTVVEREADAFKSSFSPTTSGNNTVGPSEDEVLAVKVGVAVACSFLSGAFLLCLGLLRLGFVTTYMSVSFVGGFTTAAAVHIASSQVPIMFGIKTNAYSGAGKLILMYIDLFRKIEQTKVAELLICIICMVILLLVKICINERFSSKMKMPVPIDLLVVIVATVISHFAKFNSNLNVRIVGPMPSGFAQPAAPRFVNVGDFIADAIVMGILSLAMSISMAKLTAKKHAIQIDDNQELVAYGASNLFSSFFSCFPAATAPPRTMILSSLGARTTLNAIATAIFMLLVILLIGPLFSSLPLSVLAAMIIVSMKELLLQYRTLPKTWKINRYDFVIWVVTNSVSILADLNYGVIAGIFISVFLVVVQNQLEKGNLVGISQKEDLLLNVRKNKFVEQIAGVKIFQFPTSLYFATAERFKAQLYDIVLNPQKLKKILKKAAKMNGTADMTNGDAKKGDELTADVESSILPVEKVNGIIIDCSCMSYTDIAGANMLQQVIKEYKDVNVDVYLAGIQEQPNRVLTEADFLSKFPKDRVFLDVFDAITSLKPSQNSHV